MSTSCIRSFQEVIQYLSPLWQLMITVLLEISAGMVMCLNFVICMLSWLWWIQSIHRLGIFGWCLRVERLLCFFYFDVNFLYENKHGPTYRGMLLEILLCLRCDYVIYEGTMRISPLSYRKLKCVLFLPN